MYSHIRDNSPTLSGVSSLSDSTQIKQAKKDLTSEEELLCVVCNSQASGRHYGQYSCEGCKSFFKRSIRRSISYTCRGNKDCIIDVSSRNQCQFCRLKKSIRMGMRKEVQRARIQASSLPYSYNLQGFSNIRSQSYFPNPIFSTTSFTPVTNLPSTSLNSSNIEHIQNMNVMRQIVAAENFLSNVLTNIHLKDKQLMYPVVHYARCIEAFTCMNFEDQITLLKSSWYHLFLLHYYSFPMFGIENSLLSNEKSARYYKIVVDKLRSLKLDSVECGCIKALLLFSQDNRDLLDGEKVELIQDRILYSFEEYVKTKDVSGTERRLAKLLMLLSSIKSVDSSFIIQKYLPNLENNSHCFEPLIREILLPAERVTDVSECSLNPNNLIMCSTSALAHQLPRTSNLTSRLQAMPMNINNFTNSFWTYFPFGNIFPAQPKPDGF